MPTNRQLVKLRLQIALQLNFGPRNQYILGPKISSLSGGIEEVE